MRSIRNITIALFSLLLMACSPNEKIYYKDNIACSALNRGTGDWQYYRIEIGTPNKPYAGKPEIDLMIDGIGEVKANSISLEAIKKLKDVEVKEIFAIESPPHVGEWPNSVSTIFCGPYRSFTFKNDRILQIIIMHKGWFRISGTEKCFRLPCSKADLSEIFVKTDRTYEWFRE